MVANELEPEVVKIFEAIDREKNFLLSGGAGSGKTYSLVQVIKEAIKKHPTAKVACMTYTNAAVREIEERVNHTNLNVTTIHDFLWDQIKFFQKEMVVGLLSLLRDEDSSIKTTDTEYEDDYFSEAEEIQYKEWSDIKKGIISHDEVLELSNYMYKTYPLLCDILKDKFKFIFVDEYQDTHPLVIEILLVHLKQSPRINIIGFFGDAMQAIYDNGIGDLSEFVNLKDVEEIQKEANRRNPQLVIDLANELRNDGLRQKPSDDVAAPNMVDGKIKEGKIVFLYSDSFDMQKIRQTLAWDFSNSLVTKELNLTHNLIAPKAGFGDLMEIYDNDPVIGLKNDVQAKIKEKAKAGSPFSIPENSTFDQVLDIVNPVNRKRESKKQILISEYPDLYNKLKDEQYETVRKIYLDKEALIDDKKQDEKDESKKGSKRDNLIKHLFKIQNNVHLYKSKRYNEFLRKTEFQVRTIQDKENIAELIKTLDSMSDNTIEEVIEFADENLICKKDDRLNTFIQNNQYLYERVKQIKFNQFQKLFYYLEGFTPFSTQHKIKGAEFDNVFVLLDNGDWSKYNFEYLFTDRTDKASVLNRTQKIFYVCCTRAKENLAVYYQAPSAAVIQKAKNWFGEKNVIPL